MASNVKSIEDSEIVSKTRSNNVNAAVHSKHGDQKISYIFVAGLFYVHVAAVFGIYLCFGRCSIKTIIQNLVFHTAAILGATAGAHRLWSHKSYKAKMPLQIILMLFHCVASQFSVWNWVRDHRMHHKYCDTDADPHNSTRGFFYSHFGWLMMTKHKDYIEKRKTIDMSDINSNPVLMFQKRYRFFLLPFCSLIVPVVIPMYFWNESFVNSWHVTMLRFCYDINLAFCINSFGHFMGHRPYDRNMSSSQHLLMSIATLGEGNHNFHHVFPCDYRSDEWGNNYFNLTTLFIEFFKTIGWAYDCKSVNPKVVKARAAKTGDGSYGKLI